jgi:hypothetical protein
VCREKSSDAIALIARRHVVVRADPVCAAEDDANSREIPHCEARHAHVVYCSKHVALGIEVSDTDAIHAEVLKANRLDIQNRAELLWLGWRFQDRILGSRALEGDAIFIDKQVLPVSARADTHRCPGLRPINGVLNGLGGHHLALHVGFGAARPTPLKTRLTRTAAQTADTRVADSKMRNIEIPPATVG